jgi:four helix bundle protein
MPESFQTRGFRFALAILALYRTLSQSSLWPRPIAQQLLRAGTAIGANLEEAKSAHSRRDLAAKYVVALREARECHYWLRLIAADQPHLSSSLAELLEECSQLIAVLTATVKKLRAEPTRPSGDTGTV